MGMGLAVPTKCFPIRGVFVSSLCVNAGISVKDVQIMAEANANMGGKVCLVTGANSGIGKATALGLAQRGATVVMVCRNSHKGGVARKEIQERSGNSDVDLFVADLSSQQSIRQLVRDFQQKYTQLHVLLNNAGGVFPQRKVS